MIGIDTSDALRRYMAHEHARRPETGARRSTACHEAAGLSEAEDCEGALEHGPGWRARFLAWFQP